MMQDLIAEYQGGEFSIFFANCEPLSAVSMDLRTELYNVKTNGKRDYLSIGEDALPTVYMVRLHFCTLDLLAGCCRIAPQHTPFPLPCVLDEGWHWWAMANVSSEGAAC
jgi:hypothetical protein